MVGSLFTQTYTVKSGPVSRVVTTAAPSASNVTMAAVAASQSTTANGKMLCSHQVQAFVLELYIIRDIQYQSSYL